MMMMLSISWALWLDRINQFLSAESVIASIVQFALPNTFTIAATLCPRDNPTNTFSTIDKLHSRDSIVLNFSFLFLLISTNKEEILGNCLVLVGLCLLWASCSLFKIYVLVQSRASFVGVVFVSLFCKAKTF